MTTLGLKAILAGFLTRHPALDRTRHPDEARAVGCWAEQLIGVGERLDAVAATSEDRFLTLAERLQDFYQRAEDMSARSHDMVEPRCTGDGWIKPDSFYGTLTIYYGTETISYYCITSLYGTGNPPPPDISR